jgi:hypothetical protein
MCQSFIRASVLMAFANLAVVGQVSALPLISEDSSRLVIQVQGDPENQEIWQDLRPDETPPEAAVGKEGQAPREWEKATNQADCEKAAGVWDAPNNKCSEKR